jgi:hypothetical protein
MDWGLEFARRVLQNQRHLRPKPRPRRLLRYLRFSCLSSACPQLSAGRRAVRFSLRRSSTYSCRCRPGYVGTRPARYPQLSRRFFLPLPGLWSLSPLSRLSRGFLCSSPKGDDSPEAGCT